MPKKLDQNAAKRAAALGVEHETRDQEATLNMYRIARRLRDLTGSAYHVDHVVPMSKGGPHHQSNLLVMRADINLVKGRDEWPWLEWFFQTHAWGDDPYDA